jgi:hypothetical protein
MKDVEITNVSIGDLTVGDLTIGDVRSEREKMEAIDDLTKTCTDEIGDQLKKVRAYEQKWKEQWAFDGEAGYFFSIVFRSKAERDAFLKKHHLQLRHDDHIMYEEMNHVFKEE